MEEPVGAILDELIIRHKRTATEDLLYKTADLLKDDPDKALEFASATLHEILISTSDRSQTVDWVKRIDERVYEYFQRSQNDNIVTGAPTGWQLFDEHTMGIQRGELAILFGSPGEGKTYSMCRIALGAYDAGWCPLIVAYEPSIPSLEKRLDAIVSRINPRRYRSGHLTEGEEQQFMNRVQIVKGHTHPFVICKPSNNTVSGIVQALQEYNFSAYDKWVVFIDQMSFMESKGEGHEYYKNLFSSIKQTIGPTHLNVPCWLLAQETREGQKTRNTKLYHIAVTSYAEQFADMVINIDRDGDAVVFRLLKNREGANAEFYMTMDLDRGVIEVAALQASGSAQSSAFRR